MRESFKRRLRSFPSPNSGLPGLVRQQPAQADLAGAATLADTIAAHNALLAKLRTAGILAT